MMVFEYAPNGSLFEHLHGKVLNELLMVWIWSMLLVQCWES
jgi:hypothetical protein